MDKIIKISLAGLVAFVLSGCAPHLSQDQCLNTNWDEIGYNDGFNGRMPRDLTNAIKDCEKFNLSVNTAAYQKGHRRGVKGFCHPSTQLGLADGGNGRALNLIRSRDNFCRSNELSLNLDDYQQGYDKGIVSFCTPERGQSIGSAGQPNPLVCPRGLSTAFNRGWNKGVAQFCRNDLTAFDRGRTGQAYPSVCSSARYPHFAAAFYRGARIHRRVAELKAQIDQVNRDIATAKSDMESDDRRVARQAARQLPGLQQLRADYERNLFEAENTRA